MINLSPAPAHASVSQPCLDGRRERLLGETAGRHAHRGGSVDRDGPRARRPAAVCAGRGGHAPLPVAGRDRRLRALRGAQPGRRSPRRPGPAAWREYTGDPSVFYREGVGPLIDHGIYRLHGLTMLLGPVRRVQAMGAIGNPTRVVRAGPLAGQTIPVTTPDHVLINLEFASGALGSCSPRSARPHARAVAGAALRQRDHQLWRPVMGEGRAGEHLCR